MIFQARSPAQSNARCVRTPIHELALIPIIEDAGKPCDDSFSRCGWFDSSLELAAGLQVTEFVDVLPDELPLEVLS